MADTPQPETAGENVLTLDDAAALFKAQAQPERLRDEAGRFAAAQPEEAEEAEPEEHEADAPDEGDEGEAEGEGGAPDEGQQAAAVAMPASWGKDDEELWSSLPADAQTKLSEREAQREQVVNSRLQESANARKAAEAGLEQANANRDRFTQAFQTFSSLLNVPEPNPADYGLGTEHYNRDGYDYAVYQWRQLQGSLQQHKAAFDQAMADADAQRERQRIASANEIEAIEFPKFLAEVPDLKDPAKANDIINGLIKYGVEQGIAPTAFQPGEITSREMRILWKAQQYDLGKAAEQRVKAGKPQPKPAAPAVKPGGVTNRATIQASRLSKSQARLAETGSLDDAAAVFRNMGF